MCHSSARLCLVICLTYMSQSADIFLGTCPTTLLSHPFSYMSQQQKDGGGCWIYYGDSTVFLQLNLTKHPCKRGIF